MKIELKKLSLSNFKGVVSLVVAFGLETIIRGENASGKTTVFDAFTWLLFGKESGDRKDFNIKNTVRKDLNRNDHEVEGHLVVDGTDYIFKRIYREKWQTKRGSAIEEFTGHETVFFVNDVPCSQKEYQNKVDAICNEELFKLITNPLYFPGMKWQSQREILFGMAGDVSDMDIAVDNPKFIELLAMLSGKTLEEFKKEIAAKKKRIKDELEMIPARIDEVARNTPAASDFESIAIEIAHHQKEVDTIDAQIADNSKATQAEMEGRTALQSEMYGYKTQMQKLLHEAETAAMAQANASGSERRSLSATIASLDLRLNSSVNDCNTINARIGANEAKKKELLARWYSENGRKLEFKEGDFCCPTCKRSYDVADIEAKQGEMTANFNAAKTSAMATINDEGKRLKAAIEADQKLLLSIEGIISDIKAEAAELKTKLSQLPQTDAPVQKVEPMEVPGYAELSAKVEAIALKLEEPLKGGTANVAPLKERKAEVVAIMEERKRKLAERDLIAKSQKRTDELKEQQRTMANEIAALEGLEFLMLEFTKAKVDAIEASVNGLFEIVRFKLFDMQVNGQEVETCVATVAGVPYPDLNNAMKINAGMDILKTISSYRNVFAPVFVDNAEAVTHLMHMPTQVVQLIVAKQELEIINN